MHILDNISLLLNGQGKTQKALMEHLGLSKNIYTDWRSGKCKSYKSYLPEIADFFDVCICQLIDKECKKIPPSIYPYGGDNLRVRNILNILATEDINDNDLHIIEAVLDKYKR